jgi:hypothetical protein
MSYFDVSVVYQAVIVGVIATISIDLFALLLKRGFSLPTTNWAMVGRWFGHLHKGIWIHRSIGQSQTIAHELLIGWVAHYLVGIGYALAYFYIVKELFSVSPSLFSAVIFGLATLVAPWFILQPGLGLGVIANKSPQPWVVRLISIAVHGLFGVSLYVAWNGSQF